MSVLDARDLRKAFGDKALLDGASLTLEDGERVGLVGRNGTGKTTLARILAEEEPADGGTIARRRNATVGYLAQVPTLDPAATAWSIACEGLAGWNTAKARWDEATANIERGDTSARWLEQQAEASAAIEHLGGWEPQHRVRSLLDHLHVPDASRAIGTMSGGEQRRVALARLLALEPDLAILDEPTNHLDADTIDWLETYLLETYRGAILFVTHDRYFLDRIVTRTIELSRGQLHSYAGGYGDYLAAKAERAEHEARTEQNRRNFVRRELEWLRRTPAARTGKQKARIDRAEAAIATRAPEKERAVQLAMDASRTSKTIIDAKELSIRIGDRVLVENLSLALTKGERVGIVGPNGAGKTTLLRALLGESASSAEVGGEVRRGAATQVAYLDQARSGLDPSQTVIDAVSGGRLRVEIGGENRDIRGWLDDMLFSPAQQRQPVGSLSGGERARVLTLRMLLSPASLLVLDEPTNDLDTETLSALEDMLVEFDGTALIVTHDRWLLDRVATAILAFEGDGQVVRYAGNWSTYVALRGAREQEKKAAAAPVARPSAPPPAATDAKKKSLTYAERIELDGLMPAISEAEAALATLEAEANDPDLFAKRGHEVKDRLAAVETQRAKVAALYARWEDLEQRRS